MFQYLSFRAAMAIITALLIAIVFGRRIIDRLARLQIGEEIRNLGLEGQMQKKGTPTMGGIIILLAIVVPMLLFCDLKNIYIQLMLISTIWLGVKTQKTRLESAWDTGKEEKIEVKRYEEYIITKK